MKLHAHTFCHVSLGTNNLAAAIQFYDQVLLTLGIERVCTYQHAAAYGKDYPSFWIQLPFDGQMATVGNGNHIGFKALTRDAVDQFYLSALAAGGVCNGRPGERPQYGDRYYGAFILDLDGNRIEASYWDESIKTV